MPTADITIEDLLLAALTMKPGDKCYVEYNISNNDCVVSSSRATIGIKKTPIAEINYLFLSVLGTTTWHVNELYVFAHELENFLDYCIGRLNQKYFLDSSLYKTYGEEVAAKVLLQAREILQQPLQTHSVVSVPRGDKEMNTSLKHHCGDKTILVDIAHWSVSKDSLVVPACCNITLESSSKENATAVHYIPIHHWQEYPVLQRYSNKHQQYRAVKQRTNDKQSFMQEAVDRLLNSSPAHPEYERFAQALGANPAKIANAIESLKSIHPNFEALALKTVLEEKPSSPRMKL